MLQSTIVLYCFTKQWTALDDTNHLYCLETQGMLYPTEHILPTLILPHHVVATDPPRLVRLLQSLRTSSITSMHSKEEPDETSDANPCLRFTTFHSHLKCTVALVRLGGAEDLVRKDRILSRDIDRGWAEGVAAEGPTDATRRWKDGSAPIRRVAFGERAMFPRAGSVGKMTGRSRGARWERCRRKRKEKVPFRWTRR